MVSSPGCSRIVPERRTLSAFLWSINRRLPFLAESRPKSKNSLQRSERKCWPEMTCIYNLAGLGRVFLTLPDKFFGTSNVAKIVHLAPHFRVSEAATIPDCGQAKNWPPVKTPGKLFSDVYGAVI